MLRRACLLGRGEVLDESANGALDEMYRHSHIRA